MRAASAELRCVLLGVAFVQLVLLPPALAFLPPQFGGTVAAPLPGEPLTSDPVRATRASERQLVELLYDTLYRAGRDGVARPHLAAGPPRRAPDGKRWLVPLRQSVVLHDGGRLTALDVVASLSRARAGRHGYLFRRLKKIEAHGAEAIAVEVALPAPDELALLLSSPSTAIAVKRKGKLIGSGPFRLQRWGAPELLLAAHGQHFAGRPYLDRLRLRVFVRSSTEVASYQVGAFQLSYHGVSVFGGTPRHRPLALARRPWTTVALRTGGGRPFLRDRDFRAALALAIDRKRMAKLLGSGSTAANTLGPAGLDRGATAPPFDRDRARQLLATLGRRYPQLRTSRLSLLVDSSRLDDLVLAGQLVADLDRVGVSVRVEKLPAARFESRSKAGRLDLALDRHTVALPLARFALADAFARAGDQERAARCLAKDSRSEGPLGPGDCPARGWQAVAARLQQIPLVHVAVQLHYDARLGGLELTPAGLIGFADVFWRRDR